MVLLQSNLSGQRRVAARLFRGKRPQGATLLAALGAAHAPGDILEPRIPAAQTSERARLRFALMSTLRALQHQGVLAKLIAQLVDLKLGGHGAECYGPMRSRPSSSEVPTTLYGAPSAISECAPRSKSLRRDPQSAYFVSQSSVSHSSCLIRYHCLLFC